MVNSKSIVVLTIEKALKSLEDVGLAHNDLSIKRMKGLKKAFVKVVISLPEVSERKKHEWRGKRP